MIRVCGALSQMLSAEIADTVETKQEVEQELRYLPAALAE